MRVRVSVSATLVGLCLSMTVAAQTGRVTAPTAARAAATAREQLTGIILNRWKNHLLEVYQRDIDQWASSMAPLFERASLDTLQRAAASRTFDAMNEELLHGDDPKTMPAALGEVGRLGDLANDLVYVPIAPCRVLDTRLAGGSIAAGATRDFDIADVASYSAQGGDASNCGGLGSAGSFAAVAINLTVVAPASGGFITAYPYNTSRPVAATLNYDANDVRGNLALVRLDQTAAIPELSVFSLATTHVIGDVVGYFIRPEATPLDCTNTFLASTVTANNVFDIQLPSCPSGYTITGAGCRTDNFNDADWAISGLFRSPSLGMLAFCSGINKQGGSINVEGTVQCCRVPGR